MVLVLTTFFPLITDAQTINKTISKSAQVTANVTIEANASNSDIEINTWDKNQVKADFAIEVSAKTDEDVNAFITALETAIDRQMGTGGNTLKVSLPIKNWRQNGHKIDIELEGNNNSFHLTKFKAKLLIYMPIQNNLEARNSFGNLNVGNLNANADITVSSGLLQMGNCKSLEIKTSFTKNIRIGNVENATMQISSSDIEMGDVKNDLNLRASFSGIKIAKIVNKASLNLSSSTFETSDIKELDMEASFVRRFKMRNAEKANIKLSSSEFEAMNIKTVNINNVSFSTINIDEVDKLYAPKCSSTKFYIQKANNIEATSSSFSDFYIYSLKKSFTTQSSSGSIHLTNVADGFDKIDIDGQFVNIDISVEKEANYSVSADLEFPNYNFSEITYLNRNKDLSKEVFKGYKGSEKGATSSINFDCKSCTIKLN